MKKRMTRVVLALILLALAGGGWWAKQKYNDIYASNVQVDDEMAYLYIPTEADFEAVFDSLQPFLADTASFRWVAFKKNYPHLVKPGKYHIKQGMSNNELVNKLRSGQQEPVRVTFNNVRTLADLATKIGQQIEADSTELAQALSNPQLIQKYGFHAETFLTMFIPNTYEFYWNTSAEQFIQRMADEYKAFWTPERKAKASKMGLSQSQVAILASIVQSEQSVHNDEKPVIAGLYINRLNRGMPLESDPTIVFAIGDFSIRRVLNKDKEVDSPYNTYKYAGLPPGPINLPEISSLNAVLNYKSHNYLFMCAKEDFSGYHNFASSLSQHNVYARRYQQALNKKKIYR